MAGFFLLLAAVGVAVGLLLGGDAIGAVVGIVAAAGLAFASYAGSMRLTLSLTGATPADPTRFAQLHNVVEGIAISAGLPKPAVYVVDDPAPNAFATGRDTDRAVVAVTTGLLDTMNRVELEGVVAHEIAHIRNQDIRVMTVAVATAGSIAIVTDLFWRMMFWGSVAGRSRNNDTRGGNPIALIGLVVVAILAPLAAAMLKAAISRRRETLADASAVELTRYPTGLRQALEKLHADAQVVRRTSHATSHLWIETPDDHKPESKGRSFNDMFDTHPPLAERIDLLRSIEGIGLYEGVDPDLVAELDDARTEAEHERADDPQPTGRAPADSAAATIDMSRRASSTENPTAPGWYADPDGEGQRWWDGNRWTDSQSI